MPQRIIARFICYSTGCNCISMHMSVANGATPSSKIEKMKIYICKKKERTRGCIHTADRCIVVCHIEFTIVRIADVCRLSVRAGMAIQFINALKGVATISSVTQIIIIQFVRDRMLHSVSSCHTPHKYYA